MAGLRIVFMGTPDFAVPALRALDAAGHDIACVYSQPARPAGRGKKARSTAVAGAAAELGLTVRTPEGLGDPAVRDAFIGLDSDVAVVAAYGLILPAAILSAPKYGCLNIHASLLPRWRGAAPVQRAILAGDRESGVTIMLMNEGLDTGPVLLRESVALGPETTAGELHDSLAALGARLIVTALERLPAGGLVARAQPREGVTWASKLAPGEERLDWGRPAETLAREVRALAPRPGAWFELEGARIRVLAARATTGSGAPGTLLDDALTVACGEGALALLRVQRAGKAPMEAAAFLRGRPVPAGTVLDGDGA